MPRAPRSDRDYYRVLGVGPDASEDDVRRAYRRLALQWHPDRNPGNLEAEERFKEISEAYAVLIEPARRREYDAARRGGRGDDFRVRREDLFRDLFADPRASAVFEDLAREFERIGLRVDRHVFQQTLFGGRAVVTGGVFIVSPLAPMLAIARLARAMLGSGSAERAARRPATPLRERRGVAARLLGAGRWLLGLPATPEIADRSRDIVVTLALTPEEARHGGAKRVTLRRHDGPVELLVKIPPGVRAGTKLRLRGKGLVRPGSAPGDAYLAVEITR